tara:strand:- start:114 stop:275 length:162 start_codon:yes stop_codon:yes gene_type:complete
LRVHDRGGIDDIIREGDYRAALVAAAVASGGIDCEIGVRWSDCFAGGGSRGGD